VFENKEELAAAQGVGVKPGSIGDQTYTFDKIAQ
jgi:hypothetical protein